MGPPGASSRCCPARDQPGKFVEEGLGLSEYGENALIMGYCSFSGYSTFRKAGRRNSKPAAVGRGLGIVRTDASLFLAVGLSRGTAVGIGAKEHKVAVVDDAVEMEVCQAAGRPFRIGAEERL